MSSSFKSFSFIFLIEVFNRLELMVQIPLFHKANRWHHSLEAHPDLQGWLSEMKFPSVCMFGPGYFIYLCANITL